MEVVVGGLVTLVVAAVFHFMASRDLRKQVAELREQNRVSQKMVRDVKLFTLLFADLLEAQSRGLVLAQWHREEDRTPTGIATATREEYTHFLEKLRRQTNAEKSDAE